VTLGNHGESFVNAAISSRGACPEPQALAGYVDGRLEANARRRIEAHLVGCAECREVVTGTALFVDVDKSGQKLRIAAVVGALAAALVLALWLPGARFGSVSEAPPPALLELVAAAANEPTRPAEGRLTGGFKYAPAPSPARGPSDRRPSPDVRIAAARIEKAALERDVPENEAALGIAYLTLGEFDKAIEALDDAASQRPTNAKYQNDLSVAYLARAKGLDRADDLPKALESAERAIKIDPALIEPWFNRALALEALHLDEAARTAWRQVLERDAASPWAEEARAHLAKPAPSARNGWNVLRDRVLSDLSDPARRNVAEATIHDSCRDLIREEIEDHLLPAWGTAWRDGNLQQAESALREAAMLARALERAGGDRMPADGVAVIEEALARRDSSSSARLADAHALFGQGRRMYLADRAHEASALFDTASREFVRAGSPYALWGAVYRAIAVRTEGRLADALHILDDDVLVGSASSYAFLDGRIGWLGALIEGSVGNLESAVRRCRHVLDRFAEVDERESAAAVESLMAEYLAYLGEMADAWKHQMRATSQLSNVATDARRRLILMGGTFLALLVSAPQCGLHFENEVVRFAGQNGEFSIPEAYAQRARVQMLVGDAAQAHADLATAERAAAAITDAASRRWVRAEIDSVKAETDFGTSGSGDAEAATQALRFYGGSQFPFQSVQLLRNRARAEVANADVASAERDLDLAIADFWQQRDLLSNEQARVMSFEDGWLAFADMIALQVRVKHDTDAAFRYAEAGRARSLRRALGKDVAHAPDLTQTRTALPPGVVALYYVSLDDRLLTWVLSSAGVRCIERPITGVQLTRAVRAFRSAMIHADSVRLRTVARRLYDDVFGSIAESIESGATIAIVPDGPLQLLAFAALMQPSGRYLIEDHPIVIAPSAAALLAANQRDAGKAVAARSALVVSPASTVDVTGDRLPTLPGALSEATEIADSYHRATLLVGEEATKDRFAELAGTTEIIHFAGHSIVNPQFPRLSRLMFSGTRGGSSALTADELQRVPLRATRLVALGSCEAAAGPTVRGEGTITLARTFLGGGVSSVVASLWPIDDVPARTLFTAFHRFVSSGMHPALALQRVQIDAITGGSSFDRNWAGLVAFGATPR